MRDSSRQNRSRCFASYFHHAWRRIFQLPRWEQRLRRGHRRSGTTTNHDTPASLECLEDRTLLAAFVWDGEGGDDDWNNPVNWFDQTNSVNDVKPGAADDATIGGFFSGVTIVSDQAEAVRSVTSAANITIAAGTFTVTDDSTINAVLTVNGTGSLTLSTLTLDGTGSLTNENAVTSTGSTINVDVDNRGQLQASAGAASAINGALTTDANSVILIEAAGNISNARLDVAGNFTNNGQIVLSQNSGFFNQIGILNVNGTLTNATAGLIQTQLGSGPIHQVNAVLDNQGTINAGKSLSINRASAAHTNSGTINVSGGNLIVTQTGTTPSFTNTGNVSLSVDRMFSVSGGTFDYDGGTFSGTGTLAFTGADVNLNVDLDSATTQLSFTTTTVAGVGLLTNTGGMTIAASTIAVNLDNEGLLQAAAGPFSAINGTLTTDTNSVILIEADGNISNARLDVAGNFTNNGQIVLSQNSGFFNQIGILNVNGTLTNATAGLIQTQLGGGPIHQVNAVLDNQGTINAGKSLSINRASAAHTNSGTINVSGGNLIVTQTGTTPSFTNTGNVSLSVDRTFNVNGGTFDYDGGTFSGTGILGFTGADVNLNVNFSSATAQVAFSSATVNGPGSLTNLGGVTIAASTIHADIDNRGHLQVVPGTASAINGTLTTDTASLLLLEAQAGNPGLNATLNVASSFTNNGEITFSQNNTAWNDSGIMNVNGTLTNSVTGVILAEKGSSPTHRLNAIVDNQGVINVAKNLSINRASANHTNSGTINVTGGNLTITQSGTTPSFTNTGDIILSASRNFNISGGTFNADNSGVSGAGTFALNNASLDLNLTTANTTFSTLVQLTASTVNGPGVYENVPGGTLIVAGSTVNADLFNRGRLEVFYGTASTINGALTTDSNSIIELKSLGGNPGSISQLTVSNGFTNNGRVELFSDNPSWSTPARLIVSGTLSNAATGVVQAYGGSNPTHELNAIVDNQGTFDVDRNLHLTRSSAPHTNSGTVSIAAARTLTIGNNGTFTQTGGSTHVIGALQSSQPIAIQGGVVDGTGSVNAAVNNSGGSVSPGLSPGILTTGNYNQSGGSLDIEIGGLTAGSQHDQLDVNGTVTLDGALNVTLISPFVPAFGDQFLIVDNDGSADAVSGTFAGLPEGGVLVGGGVSFQITYAGTTVGGDGNDVVLTVVGDFGDAPDAGQSGFAATYPVTLADDGARHSAAGATLGSERDAENDGTNSAAADFDDTNGTTPDDEDGVMFVNTSLLVTAIADHNDARVQIDLQNADASSNLLDAWIDFNQNGDWTDPGEQIFTSFDLGTSNGVQTLNFTIPQDTGANVVEGQTFARFRVSTTGGLLPTGGADDGEVEDHTVTLVSCIDACWDGGPTGTGTDWNVAANWVGDIVPGASDDVVIGSGFTGITSSQTNSIRSLMTDSAVTMAAGTFTITNNSTIDAGLTVTGGTLNLDSLTLSGSGTLTNQGTLSLMASTVNVDVANQGVLCAPGPNSQINGALTTNNSSTIRIGATGGGPGSLTVANGFTNNGAIELTELGFSGFDAIVAVTTGTLVNASTGTITTLGTAGPRTIQANVDNQGVISASLRSLSINGSTFDTSSGELSVAGGLSVAIGGGTTTIGSGTTLSGTGTINLNGTHSLILDSDVTLVSGGPSLTFPGTVTVGPSGRLLTSQTSLSLTGDTVNADFANQGLLQVPGPGSQINGALTTNNSSTIRIGATGGGPGSLTVANGFTNNGAIELTELGFSGFDAIVAVTTGTLVNASTGTITTLGTAGPRTIQANVDNQGVISASLRSLSINGSTFDTSSGELSVAGGLSVAIDGGTTTIGSGTTLSGTGTINLNGTHSLILDSDVTLVSGGPSLTFPGTVTVGPSGRLLTSQTSLSLTGDTVNADFANQGLLQVPGPGSQINGALTTNSSSTIRIGATGGGSGSLTVANGFTNNGAIELTELGFSGFDAIVAVTTGTLVNASTGTITTLGTAGPRTIQAQVDNQGSITVDVRPLTINKAAADHTNSGTISVTNSNLTITQSGTTPSFTNTGNIEVSSGRTFTISGSDLTNDAGGTLSGEGMITTDISSDGSVSPGFSAGTLTANGNYFEVGNGSFDVEIGPTVNDVDQLVATGDVTLAGSLNISLFGGFEPVVGDAFLIVDKQSPGPISGTFNGLAEGDLLSVGSSLLQVSYLGGTGNDVVLTAVAAASLTLDGSNNLQITENGFDTDDVLTIQSDTSNTQLVISSANGPLATNISGASGHGTTTITVPFSAVTGGEVFVNTLGGDDVLTIDLTPGNFAKGILFDGGDPVVGPGDSLILTGGPTFTTVTHNINSASSGTIDITGNSTITYTGLEPVVDNLNVLDRLFVFTGSDETVTLSDDANSDDGASQIDSTLGESIVFTNPTGSLSIETGSGTGPDIILVEGLDGLFDADLVIDGDADDAIRFQINSTLLGTGSLTADAATIQISVSATTTGAGMMDLQATRGLLIDSGATLSTVNGNLMLRSNQGVTPVLGQFEGVVLNGGSVTSVDGNITIAGRAGDTGEDQIGVDIFSFAVVEATGAGSISITGIGGGDTNLNEGVLLDESSAVRVSTGMITITGTAGGGNSAGVEVFDSSVTSTGNGTISITGTGNGLASGIVIDGSGTVGGPSAAGNIQLTTDTFFLGGTMNVQSAGTLTISPLTPGTSLGLGNGSGTLQIDAGEISRLTDGFAAIIIGDATDGNGAVDIDTVTFTDPVTITSPAAGGSIVLDGPLLGNDNASVTLDGPGGTTTLNSDIVTQGNSITINDNVIVGNFFGAVLNTTSGVPGGADITIAGDVEDGGGAQSLTLQSGTTGDIAITGNVGEVTSLGAVAVLDARNVLFGGTIDAVSVDQGTGTGTTTFNGVVDLSGNIQMTTTAIQMNADSVTADQHDYAASMTLGQATTLSINGAANTTSTIGAVDTDGFGLVLDIVTGGGNEWVGNGVITGGGSVTKTGLNTLTLTADNTYTGGTVIAGGTMALASTSTNNIISGSPVIDVQTGAFLDVTGLDTGTANDTLILSNGQTLMGTGTVIGTTQGGSGSTIAPGASPGILNSGSVNFTAGSSFDVEFTGNSDVVGTNHDQLNVIGSVTIDSSAVLNPIIFPGGLDGDFEPNAGDAYVIINNDGGDPVIGSFNGLPEGAVVDTDWGLDGLTSRITYVGGDGNDVVIINSVPVNLSVSADSGTEAAMTAITVTVTADIAVTGNQTVDVTVTGTGITSGDYTLTDDDAGTAGIQIEILDGETTGSVTFTVEDDIFGEGTETATLNISNPSSGISLGPAISQDIDITDNDTSTTTFEAPRHLNAPKHISVNDVSWFIQFSADVFNVAPDGSDFDLNFIPGGAVSVTDAGDADASTFVLTVQGVPEATLQIDQINAGTSIVDGSGNTPVLPRQGTNGDHRYKVDRTAPTPVISSSEGSPTNASPIPISVDFGEGVFGFEQSDLSVTNGTISNFATTDFQTFTFNITPAANGLITVDIAAAAANDPALNPSNAAAQFTITSHIVNVAITRVDPTPTTATTVDFHVNFSEDVVSVDATDFVVVTTGSASGNPVVTVGDAGDTDDSTYVVSVTSVSRHGTLGLDLTPATDITGTAMGTPVTQTPTVDEVYDIINDAHGILSLVARTPGNVMASVSGANLLLTPDAGDNGISISTTAGGDVVVAGVGGTTINGVAEFVAFAGVSGIAPGNVTVVKSAGRDFVSVADLTVTGKLTVFGGDDVSALDVINVTVNGNTVLKEKAGDGFIDVNDSTFMGVAQFFGGDGNNTIVVNNANFLSVLSVLSGDDNDTITLNTVSVSGSTQFSPQAGHDTINLTNTDHLSTLYITAADGNDTINGNDVDVTATTYLNMGAGNDIVDFDDLHAMSTAVLIAGADNDAVRFLSSQFDGVANMPISAGSNVIDVQGTTFNGATYLQASGGELGVRIKNNIFTSTVSLKGGPGGRDALLDNATSSYSGTPGVSGFEDLSNTHIDAAFSNLLNLLFP